MQEVRAAYGHLDWTTLGYGSWQEYVQAEYGESAFPVLTAQQRDEIAVELSGDSMSTRAIAAVLGVSQSTVQRAVTAGESFGSPKPEEKTYAVTAIGSSWAPPNPGPSPDQSGMTPAKPKVKGVDGKSYPKAKPAVKKPKAANAMVVHAPDCQCSAARPEGYQAPAPKYGYGGIAAMETLIALDPGAHVARYAGDDTFRELVEKVADWLTVVREALDELDADAGADEPEAACSEGEASHA